MRSVVGKIVLGILVAVVTTTVSAQWPKYTTPDVPRLADGQPNLTAPAPRTADGKVDFSGIWEIVFGGGGGRGRGAAPAPAPPPDPNATPVSQFFEVAGRGYPLPLQPWAAELKKKRMADNSRDNPDVWCLPIGLMQYHNHPQPRQIVQTKNLMLITYESNYGLRYIYMDGRPAPNNDPTPWWFGYSRGWWEGDTLVVETTNFVDRTNYEWANIWTRPSESLRLVERFKRIDATTMEYTITVEDPTTFTRPWTAVIPISKLSNDTQIYEYACHEGNYAMPNLLRGGRTDAARAASSR
jgi:hypothetical protein